MPSLAIALTWTIAALGQVQPGAVAEAPGPLTAEPFRHDARLWDVAMFDAERGWAVGDRGTIWHTRDGGRSWRLQPTGTDASLRSIAVIDSRRALVVGSRARPYTHRSEAVVLTTRDGGQRWLPNNRLTLPGLKQIHMFDERHGWALGDGSALYPSGVFLTGDGGRSFRPLAGPSVVPWLCGDMLSPGAGSLAGRRGTMATIRGGDLVPGRVGQFGLRNLRRMKLLPPTGGWLVGDGGLVLTTPDGGASWQTPETSLPDVAAAFDFQAIAAVGRRVWVAGTPGTRVFTSYDAGRTWRPVTTGVRAPIYALQFRDPDHGVAVGELGTILVTDDGGASWQRVQAGGGRAALMAVFSRPEDVPLELLVKYSAEDGYRAAVELINRRDVEVRQPDTAHAADRAHEAAVATGACAADSAWRFPLRQPGLALSGEQVIGLWDRANDGRGVDALLSHLVRQIRIWRPDVIVTHSVSPRGDNPRGHLVNQLVLRAVSEAADPSSHPELASGAGLPPWQVTKVFGLLEPGGRGMVEVSTGQLAPRMGGSLAEAAAEPHGLLHDEFHASPEVIALQQLVSRLSRGSSGDGLFDGIALQPGGEARRRLPPATPDHIDTMQRLAARRRHTRAIIERSGQDTQTATNLLAHTSQMTRGLDDRNAARLLFHLAERYRRGGRWSLAAETYGSLVDQYPDSPLVEPAAAWLIPYHASGEAAWRVQGRQRVRVSQGTGAIHPEAGHPSAGVRHASALATEAAEAEAGPKRADQLADRFERTRPELYADPAIRFPLAAADRRRGYPKQAERFYLTQSHRSGNDPWHAAARGELWLIEPEGEPPKPLLRCRRAAAKPHLDGRLDEDVWHRAQPARLESLTDDDRDWPTEVHLAYDDEFLYLAVRCTKAPGVEYPAAGASARRRDTDLTHHDRIELYLDIDRDFSTYYRLTADHRGWPGDGCWGDATWNPTWFIATASEQSAWTLEAAIPLEELTGRYPGKRDVWAIGLQRIVPGVGFQSWTSPAAVDVIPAGFGYLVFEGARDQGIRDCR